MKRSITATAGFLCGCATSGAPGAPPTVDHRPPERIVVEGSYGSTGTTLSYEVEGNLASFVLEGLTPEQAWPALLEAYETIGIPVDQVSATTRTVAANGVVFSRSLDGERLSRFFSCGTSMVGPVADRSRITATIATTLEARGESLAVRTRMDAVATPNDGSAANRPCTSRFVLEERIARHVRDGERTGGVRP